MAEEGGRGRLRFRLTCTRPAPAHLKHTTVLVVVVVVIVVVAGMVVVGVDDTGGVELEAMNDGGGGRRLILHQRNAAWPGLCLYVQTES